MTRHLPSWKWGFSPQKGETMNHFTPWAKESRGPAPSNSNAHCCKSMQNHSPRVENNICVSVWTAWCYYSFITFLSKCSWNGFQQAFIGSIRSQKASPLTGPVLLLLSGLCGPCCHVSVKGNHAGGGGVSKWLFSPVLSGRVAVFPFVRWRTLALKSLEEERSRAISVKT